MPLRRLPEIPRSNPRLAALDPLHRKFKFAVSYRRPGSGSLRRCLSRLPCLLGGQGSAEVS